MPNKARLSQSLNNRIQLYGGSQKIGSVQVQKDFYSFQIQTLVFDGCQTGGLGLRASRRAAGHGFCQPIDHLLDHSYRTLSIVGGIGSTKQPSLEGCFFLGVVVHRVQDLGGTACAPAGLKAGGDRI